MHRTILDLIEAVFADETLTPPELNRLHRYFPRLWPLLLLPGPITPVVRLARRQSLRRIQQATPRQLRAEIHYLHALGLEFAAAWDGNRRAPRTQGHRGGQKNAQRHQEENEKLLARFGLGRTNRAAVERYQKEQEEWLGATADEQKKLVDSMMRRVRRARKRPRRG